MRDKRNDKIWTSIIYLTRGGGGYMTRGSTDAIALSLRLPWSMVG